MCSNHNIDRPALDRNDTAINFDAIKGMKFFDPHVHMTSRTTDDYQAMANAEVGDDVFGDDPTVNALQARLAAELGFAAGLFVASGTQSNLLALMAHCERGDEYLVGSEAHTYKYEGGGAAVLGSIQPQPIANQPDGSIALKKLTAIGAPSGLPARSRATGRAASRGAASLGHASRLPGGEGGRDVRREGARPVARDGHHVRARGTGRTRGSRSA